MNKVDVLFHLVTPFLVCFFVYISSLSLHTFPTDLSSQAITKLKGRSKMPYDQFILFGDSLFQHSSSQERGYSLAPALQAGKSPEVHSRLHCLDKWEDAGLCVCTDTS